MEDNILKEDLSKNKKLTPEFKKRIKKVLGINLLLAAIIVVYMFAIQFGFYNLELNTLETILKVIASIILVFAIYKFEMSYKKDNEGIFLSGVEALIVALITLFMTSFINIEEGIFKNIIYGICIFVFIYYLIKSFVQIRKIKKEHKKQISDVREIIEK